jgi:hypothetical protein
MAECGAVADDGALVGYISKRSLLKGIQGRA